MFVAACQLICCSDLLQEKWYALVANATFMFNDVQNEALAEQLREKKRFYGEQVWSAAILFAPTHLPCALQPSTELAQPKTP